MPRNLTRKAAKAIKRRLEHFVEDTKGLTWYRFTEDAGLPHATTSDWRNYKKDAVPGVPKLIDIAERHGMSIDWLLLGEGGELRGTSRPKKDLSQDLREWVLAELERPYTPDERERYMIDLQVPPGDTLLNFLVRKAQEVLKMHFDSITSPVVTNFAWRYLDAKSPAEQELWATTLARAVLAGQPASSWTADQPVLVLKEENGVLVKGSLD